MFNIRKRDEQKHYAKNGRIGKYAFLLFEKGMSKKNALGKFRFVSMLFLILEKIMRKEIAPAILRFVSMVLKGLKKGWGKKLCEEFWGS